MPKMKGTLTKEVRVEVDVVDALDAMLVSTISKFDGMADAAGYSATPSNIERRSTT